jgi:hypothetical protein
MKTAIIQELKEWVIKEKETSLRLHDGGGLVMLQFLDEKINELELKYASHPSPMSASDMTAKEYFDGEGSPLTLSKICSDEEKEFLLQHIELYASGKVHQSKQPPMSAEQVEEAYAGMFDNEPQESTTPSVKADGWVSVEEKMPDHNSTFPKKLNYVLVYLDYSEWGRDEQRIEMASVHYADSPQPYGGPNSLTGAGILTGTYFALPTICNPKSVKFWQPLPAPPKQQ